MLNLGLLNHLLLYFLINLLQLRQNLSFYLFCGFLFLRNLCNYVRLFLFFSFWKFVFFFTCRLLYLDFIQIIIVINKVIFLWFCLTLYLIFNNINLFFRLQLHLNFGQYFWAYFQNQVVSFKLLK